MASVDVLVAGHAQLIAERQAARARAAGRRAAMAKFAAQRGWLVAKRQFSLVDLIGRKRARALGYDGYGPETSDGVDHPECYRLPGPWRRPVAMVVHLYNGLAGAEALAERLGLDFEPLPESWYSPQTRAGVYIRREGP